MFNGKHPDQKIENSNRTNFMKTFFLNERIFHVKPEATNFLKLQSQATDRTL